MGDYGIEGAKMQGTIVLEKSMDGEKVIKHIEEVFVRQEPFEMEIAGYRFTVRFAGYLSKELSVRRGERVVFNINSVA